MIFYFLFFLSGKNKNSIKEHLSKFQALISSCNSAFVNMYQNGRGGGWQSRVGKEFSKGSRYLLHVDYKMKENMINILPIHFARTTPINNNDLALHGKNFTMSSSPSE
jgi:SET domain-containing protein